VRFTVWLIFGSASIWISLANERRSPCFAGILPKPMFGLVVLNWLTLALLEKQKTPQIYLTLLSDDLHGLIH
jgi:hypothetical protein